MRPLLGRVASTAVVTAWVQRVARHHQPAPAAADVVPVFAIAGRADCRADRHSRSRPPRPASACRPRQDRAPDGELFLRARPQCGQWIRLAMFAPASMQIGLGADALFVDEIAPRAKRSSRKARAVSCGSPRRDQVREAEAGGRRRLEAAIAPAGVEVEVVGPRPVDDRRAIHRHVHRRRPRTAGRARATGRGSGRRRLPPHARPSRGCRAAHRSCSRRCRRRRPARPCRTGDM